MTIELGILIALVSGIVAILVFATNQLRNARSDGANIEAMKKDIEYIKVEMIEYLRRDMGEIKDMLKDSQKESSAAIKRLHERIDQHLRDDHGFKK